MLNYTLQLRCFFIVWQANCARNAYNLNFCTCEIFVFTLIKTSICNWHYFPRQSIGFLSCLVSISNTRNWLWQSKFYISVNVSSICFFLNRVHGAPILEKCCTQLFEILHRHLKKIFILSQKAYWLWQWSAYNCRFFR